jgi:predicted NBD/HSP70 family sugar kinase/predicted transcriptional regulator
MMSTEVVRGSMCAVLGSDADPPAGIVSTTSAVRVVNERAVYEAFLSLATASAAELVTRTGLSKPTVSVALSDLERVGLIEQLGRRTGNAGRAPRLYRLRAQAAGAVAVDVGGSWLRAAVVDLTGTVLSRDEQRSRSSSAARLVTQIADLVERLVHESGLDREAITATVIGSPGVYDEAAGVVHLAPNLPGWGRAGVVAELRNRLPGRLRIENDINLAALAELAHMAEHSRRAPDFVFLSAGTGLGMGIVVNGRLLRGAQGAAGEISYLPLGSSTTPPVQRGRSLEQLTAPAAIVEQAHASGLSGVRRPEEVFDAARAGSPAAQRAVQTEALRLVTAIAGVMAVLDPALVVLGGGIGRNGDLLLPPIEHALVRLVPLRVPELRVSELGPDAPLLGAVAAGLERARSVAFEAALGAAIG